MNGGMVIADGGVASDETSLEEAQESEPRST